MRRSLWVLLLSTGLVGPACNDATPAGSIFEATLAGANEVPPRSSGGTGTAGLFVDGSTVHYSLVLGGISNVIGAHIHVGAAGVNGPIIVSFFPGPGRGNFTTATDSVDRILASGTFIASDIAGRTLDQFLADANAGNLYVNVHTTALPGGEIRGQLRLLQ